MKSIKVSVHTTSNHFTVMVPATSKRNAVEQVARLLGSYRMIDRAKYVRAVSLVGSLDAGWFNAEAS